MSSCNSLPQQPFSGLNPQPQQPFLASGLNPESSSGLNQQSSKKFCCSICSKEFQSRSGFYYHKNKMHSAETSATKIEKSFAFKCDECHKNFNKKHHLMYHNRHHHSFPKGNLVKCGICYKQVEKKNFSEHVLLVHDIECETEDLIFPSFDKFIEWKEQLKFLLSQNMLQSTVL